MRIVADLLTRGGVAALILLIVMNETGRHALRGLLCMLLALLAMIGGSSLRAPGPHVAAASERQERRGEPAHIAAAHFDVRLPFLAGSSAMLAAPAELPTRVTASARSRTAETTRDHSPLHSDKAILTALRLRIANDEHAAVARVLEVARAGRAEARSTPPPFSVS